MRAYLIDPASADTTRIRVAPNQPAVSGTTNTTLSEEHGAWTASFAVQLRVERGELNSLRLRVSPNWTGPFAVTPAAVTEFTPATRAGQNAMLTVHLPQPVGSGESVALRIRSPLALPDGQSPSAPRIAPQIPGEWRQYLALPTSLEGESVAWTHVGIEPTAPPDDLQLAPAPSGTQSFRIAADAFSVSLRPRATGGSTASVRLAETATFDGPAGGRFSVTQVRRRAAGTQPMRGGTPRR